MINGNMIGNGAAPLKTLIIEDEYGNQVTGVVTESLVVFDATDNDVRAGMTYASNEGVSVGTKDIPIYRTYQSSVLIFPEEHYSISLSQYDMYDYTKLQGIVSKFNTSFEDSVYTDKIIINDCVYAVNSLDPMSNIYKDVETKSINLNIVNNTEDIYVINFFTYKEEV